MKKGKEEKKDKKKTLSKNQKIVIAIVVISVFLIAGCAVNIYFAYKSGDCANIFTAISGWLGFLATVGVGIITIYQNKRSERNLYRQNEINKLVNLRDKLYASSKSFADNDYTAEIILRTSDENFIKYVMNVLFTYKNLCLQQANEINTIRYNFEGLVQIYNDLLNICLGIKELLNSKKNSFDTKIIQLNKMHHDIVDLYNDLLIDIDDAIESLSDNKKSYKNFSNKLEKLKEYNAIRPKIEKIAENYNKETQNGQAKDDVNGQDK